MNGILPYDIWRLVFLHLDYASFVALSSTSQGLQEKLKAFWDNFARTRVPRHLRPNPNNSLRPRPLLPGMAHSQLLSKVRMRFKYPEEEDLWKVPFRGSQGTTLHQVFYDPTHVRYTTVYLKFELDFTFGLYLYNNSDRRTYRGYWKRTREGKSRVIKGRWAIVDSCCGMTYNPAFRSPRQAGPNQKLPPHTCIAKAVLFPSHDYIPQWKSTTYTVPHAQGPRLHPMEVEVIRFHRHPHLPTTLVFVSEKNPYIFPPVQQGKSEYTCRDRPRYYRSSDED